MKRGREAGEEREEVERELTELLAPLIHEQLVNVGPTPEETILQLELNQETLQGTRDAWRKLCETTFSKSQPILWENLKRWAKVRIVGKEQARNDDLEPGEVRDMGEEEEEGEVRDDHEAFQSRVFTTKEEADAWEKSYEKISMGAGFSRREDADLNYWKSAYFVATTCLKWWADQLNTDLLTAPYLPEGLVAQQLPDAIKAYVPADHEMRAKSWSGMVRSDVARLPVYTQNASMYPLTQANSPHRRRHAQRPWAPEHIALCIPITHVDVEVPMAQLRQPDNLFRRVLLSANPQYCDPQRILDGLLDDHLVLQSGGHGVPFFGFAMRDLDLPLVNNGAPYTIETNPDWGTLTLDVANGVLNVDNVKLGTFDSKRANVPLRLHMITIARGLQPQHLRLEFHWEHLFIPLEEVSLAFFTNMADGYFTYENTWHSRDEQYTYMPVLAALNKKIKKDRDTTFSKIATHRMSWPNVGFVDLVRWLADQLGVDDRRDQETYPESLAPPLARTVANDLMTAAHGSVADAAFLLETHLPTALATLGPRRKRLARIMLYKRTVAQLLDQRNILREFELAHWIIRAYQQVLAAPAMRSNAEVFNTITYEMGLIISNEHDELDEFPSTDREGRRWMAFFDALYAEKVDCTSPMCHFMATYWTNTRLNSRNRMSGYLLLWPLLVTRAATGIDLAVPQDEDEFDELADAISDVTFAIDETKALLRSINDQFDTFRHEVSYQTIETRAQPPPRFVIYNERACAHLDGLNDAATAAVRLDDATKTAHLLCPACHKDSM